MPVAAYVGDSHTASFLLRRAGSGAGLAEWGGLAERVLDPGASGRRLQERVAYSGCGSLSLAQVGEPTPASSPGPGLRPADAKGRCAWACAWRVCVPERVWETGGGGEAERGAPRLPAANLSSPKALHPSTCTSQGARRPPGPHTRLPLAPAAKLTS